MGRQPASEWATLASAGQPPPIPALALIFPPQQDAGASVPVTGRNGTAEAEHGLARTLTH
eukprot:11209474-Lingulodinium_polyedra.AAC.1